MSTTLVGNGVSSNDYTYVNEDQIDSELKCIICQQPFVKPLVGKGCGHTFCSICIQNWLRQNSSCPSCRKKTSFESVTTRVVLSQLDHLHVRCFHCQRNDIQRGNFDDHIQRRCPAIRVKCDAHADLKCSWRGLRQEKEQHLALCPLLQIRPIVESLRIDILVQGHQLQYFMEEMRNELNHLRNEINQLTRNRPTTVNAAQPPTSNKEERQRYIDIINNMKHTWVFIKMTDTSDSTYRTNRRNYNSMAHQIYSISCKFCTKTEHLFFKCCICSCEVARGNVAAHDSSNPEIAVICRVCVKKYHKN